jgi:hypothetical protein
MDALGVTGMDLARALGRSQSSIARYYADREPDYPMTVEIERVLGLPPGTLMSVAGYTASLSDCDMLAALVGDDSLTEDQKAVVLRVTVLALVERGRRNGRDDAMAAARCDPRLNATTQRMLAELVGGYREMNRAKSLTPSRRPTPI